MLRDERVGGFVRRLSNGRELHLVRQLYNLRLSIGAEGSLEWDDSW
jgi:hypothetical protein